MSLQIDLQTHRKSLSTILEIHKDRPRALVTIALIATTTLRLRVTTTLITSLIADNKQLAL